MLAQRAASEGWEGVAWPSSCSRNAHDQNVLVRRAQSRIDQATLENEMGEVGIRLGRANAVYSCGWLLT